MKRSGGYRYVVTLKNKSDLDDFYSEMESSNGTENIPNRKVQCFLKRPLSRSTHYQLTDEEASKLKNDDRVLCVEEQNKEMKSKLCWDEPQNANWDKNPESIDDKNWALKRCIDGQQTSNWGTDGISEITGSVNTTSSGRNVDIVIVDSHIDPNHSEFSDGNGGSRVNQIDWFALYRTIVDPDNEHNIPNNYSYSNMTSAYHGTHVAGIAAGNTQGWARDANIYNIAFDNSIVSGDFTFGDWSAMLYEFIQAFHETKLINPATGRKNPTIVNGSYSFFISPIYLYNFISPSVGTELVLMWRYRGTAGFFMGNSDERKVMVEDRRVPVTGNDEKGNYIPDPPVRSAEVDNDIKDLIDTGVIIVAASGNDSFSIDVEGGADYDNLIAYRKLNEDGNIYNYPAYYPNRGATPGAAEGVICVGSVGAKVAEYKSDFSNFEKRVDIWAPGSNIMSSVPSSNYKYSNTGGPQPWPSSDFYCYWYFIEPDVNPSWTLSVMYIVWEGILIYSNQTVTGDPPPDLSQVPVGPTIPLPEGDNTIFTINGFVYEVGERKGDHSSSSNNMTAFSYEVKRYGLGNLSGTSMASPQVAGLLACLAEQWPTMKQADALQFLKEGSKSQVGNNLPAGNSVTESPYEAFGDGNNRYVHYVYKRPQTGTVYPHPNYANRNVNTSGIKYPRSPYRIVKGY